MFNQWQDTGNTQWESLVSSINGVGKTIYAKEIGSLFLPLTKCNSKWIKGINGRPQTNL